jgi:hypothetical protein
MAGEYAPDRPEAPWAHRTEAQVAATQPRGLTMRVVEGGNLFSLAAGRRGRRTSSPPQFGHSPPSRVDAQLAQNVHSKEQISALSASGGRSTSQHSQEGRSSSTAHSIVSADAAGLALRHWGWRL